MAATNGVPAASAGGGNDATIKVAKQRLERNVHELAALIVKEAGGQGPTAETAVGCVVVNRMKLNHATTVDQVWSPAFRHGKAPHASQLATARGILTATLPDPTSGSTHFYTPQAMPKAGDSTKNRDVGGGSEKVKGVVDDDGNPVQSYKPGWVAGLTQHASRAWPRAYSSFTANPAMGMSARIASAATLALALALALSGPAGAAPDLYAGILNGPATQAEVNEANRVSGGCGIEECAAVRDVARAFTTIFHRDVPGTMAHVPQPADPSRAANQALEQGLLAHRSRYGNYCAILTKLARNYSEYFIGHASIELANRIDGKSDWCTAAVLAALPKTSQVGVMVEDARDSCKSDGRESCGRDTLR